MKSADRRKLNIMKAKPPTPKKRHSKSSFYTIWREGSAGGNCIPDTCNLTQEEEAKFHAAYNADEAVLHRRSLLADSLLFSEGNAAWVIELSDERTLFDCLRSSRPLPFAHPFADLMAETDLRGNEKAQTELGAIQNSFSRRIGGILHKWIQDRDAASFRRLADLLETMKGVTHALIQDDNSFVERAFKARPTLGVVVWKMFQDCCKKTRERVKPPPSEDDAFLLAAMMLKFAGNSLVRTMGPRKARKALLEMPKLAGEELKRTANFGVPTKAELREAVENEWENLGKKFSQRDFTRELSRLGLSGLPSAPPIKKDITRGK